MAKYVFEITSMFGGHQNECTNLIRVFTAETDEEFTKKLTELVEYNAFVTIDNIDGYLRSDFNDFLNGKRNYITVDRDGVDHREPTSIGLKCFTVEHKIELYVKDIERLKTKINLLKEW